MEEKEIVLLTPEELAELTKMSLKFVKKHIHTRRLPGMTRCGHNWRFRKDAVVKRLIAGELLLPEAGR